MSVPVVRSSRCASSSIPGDVLFIPAGVNHGAKSVGSVRGAELATYIAEKGKPLVVLAQEHTDRHSLLHQSVTFIFRNS